MPFFNVCMQVFYDGECPLCSQYTIKLGLEKAVGLVELINLRERPEMLAWLKSKGVDPDLGMVVFHANRLYHGADAMRLLARLSSAPNVIVYFFNMLLSNSVISAVLYPFLRIGRNLLLLLLGHTSLSRSEVASLSGDRVLFFIFGFFAFLHLLVYEFQFGAKIYWSTYLIAILGLALFWGIKARFSFMLLVAVMAFDSIAQMPSLSNHTILKNFFLSAIVISGVARALRGHTWNQFWSDILPVGRTLLVIMYFFGVFHKINQDFLNPQVSCALALWDMMPGILPSFRGEYLDYVYIYGTFTVEGALLVLLFVPQLRHIGISLGMAFHMLLALSAYAMYAPFSVLSIFLHACFLSPDASRNIVRSIEWKYVEDFLKSPLGIFAMVLTLLLLYLSAWLGRYSDVAIVSFLIVFPVCYLIIRYGRDDRSSGLDYFLPKNRWLTLIGILFFFNCITPYLGLKTAQSMNMFANLRLEKGSNHLLLGRVSPFEYLNDVVLPIKSTGSRKFEYIQTQGVALTYYSLLDELERNRNATVSFWRGGRLFEGARYDSLKQDAEAILHPRWFRAWFHFSPVDLKSPKICALDR
ncbi:DUF393 domain-containing protein [Microbulbifer sp. SH-1]|uniref:DCC1-like thiol-disulfide oxidoreductase family protein n=1 Tax=Microbulbifer sp. SH-1 TaxID=2681547 RepID=UPI00140A431E|nr:DCC1-like thiol-disulfide oxidoreductase family protein [Microbulbifer sp. SH-1]QIL88443.1 DUF393 domain-containing protein [Microbulbifer sp. SH-1]